MTQLAADLAYGEDFHSNSDNQPFQTSTRPKNEWQELIQHQAQMAKWLADKEKELKNQQKQFIGEELDKLVSEKELVRQRQLEERRRDAEAQRRLKEQYDMEQQRKQQQKLEHQREMAAQYMRQHQSAAQQQLQKREEERTIEENIIRSSLDSLQREKLEKRRKQAEFKQSAFEIVQEKEFRKQQEMLASKARDFGGEELVREEKAVEQAKNENYKQFYNQWSDQRQLLDQLHEHRVLKEKSDRERKIEAFINKGIRDDQMKWETDQQLKAQNNNKTRNQLAAMLQHQIGQKEQVKVDERLFYPQKAERVVKETSDYQNYLSANKEKKIEQQKFYKEILDQQKQELEEKKRNAEKMTEKERILNQQAMQSYKNPQIKIDPLVMGVSSNRLNYLISPTYARRKNEGAAGEQYNPLTGAPTHLISPKNQHMKQFSNAEIGGGRNEQRFDSNEPVSTRNRNAVNRSLNLQPTLTSPNHRQLQANNSMVGVYNPITNPIPNYNQNPYIRGGRGGINPSRNVLVMAADSNLVN
eukprot:CAMPEP_0176440440 /NCGR_PEP_ID=MMETSP0127-20121128/20574_1 /TAXON_ID=938130 /ORGANISM="Platyophrya macrostoma, Strain WH" /LENGTH=527 /DNA_ID=CAMNT_0017824969 /DNA_START=16 /DNA_END=1599 /DNA_ORIENTATION=-